MTWHMAKFGSVCKFVRGPFGGSLKKSCFKEEGYAVYEQQHAIYEQFNDIRYFIDEEKFIEMSRFELAPNDLIMSCSGTMGKIAIVPDGITKGIINQALLKLTPNDCLLPDFLKLWMNSPNFQGEILSLAQGAAIKNMASVKILKDINVPIPSHIEQQQIVDLLDKAFADIEQARQNTEQNLRNARELFDSYLQQVFSECGEGWKKTTLNELCTKFEYGTSSKSSQEGEVPVIRMGNIQDGRIVMDKLVYSLNEEDNQKYHLNFNDVLFNRTNSAELVGKTAIYKSEERAIFAGYLIRIHRNEKLLNADYLNFYLNSPIARKYGEQVMSQSTNQANISGTKLKTYPISIPESLEEQQSIVDKISTLKEKVEELEATHKSKLTALDELKQSLLQQAFTGQLTQG
ncbi:restriction endonuclease subunit S [Vibrio owensii]|uniref:restriction endonuclease subunit S n=1 Tax=Vibrio owensii TaxID=696485 RepID=UPI00406772A7